MKQIILDIPDNEFDFFMKLIQKFKYKTHPGLTISNDVKKMVDERRKTAKKADYLTVSQSNDKIRKKYGF